MEQAAVQTQCQGWGPMVQRARLGCLPLCEDLTSPSLHKSTVVRHQTQGGGQVVVAGRTFG